MEGWEWDSRTGGWARPKKQTLKEIKEKWKTMAGGTVGMNHPLNCTHEHCNYWRNNSTKKVWEKELKQMEKKMKLLNEEAEDY